MRTDMSEITTRTYTVQGMSCGHCRVAVSEEVGDVAGVSGVEVDLASGRLEVQGSAIDDAAVAAAVEEAGYRLADAA